MQLRFAALMKCSRDIRKHTVAYECLQSAHVLRRYSITSMNGLWMYILLHYN